MRTEEIQQICSRMRIFSKHAELNSITQNGWVVSVNPTKRILLSEFAKKELYHFAWLNVRLDIWKKIFSFCVN